MRSGPGVSPFWWRTSCSKNGFSVAAFSTGMSAPLAIFWNTASWASALARALTGGPFGIMRRRAEETALLDRYRFFLGLVAFVAPRVTTAAASNAIPSLRIWLILLFLTVYCFLTGLKTCPIV